MKPPDWDAADERDAWEALMDEECPVCGYPVRDHVAGECPESPPALPLAA